MEEGYKVNCTYCGKETNNPKSYFLDSETKHLFCRTGCRDMWWLEHSAEYNIISGREKGMERF